MPEYMKLKQRLQLLGPSLENQKMSVKMNLYPKRVQLT